MSEFSNKLARYDGFWLRHCSDNEISANDIVANDMYSLAFYYSSNNSIYNNNLISTQQIYCEESANTWDDGYPSGGNYWSDYVGVDSNQDGIVDYPYVLDANNTDNYPLAGIFFFYEYPYSEPNLLVTLVSNSSISNFNISVSPNHPEDRMIRFNVTGEGVLGFCRVCIPHTLMNGTYQVTVDGTEPHYVNYSIADNAVHRWIYFAYHGLNHQITVIPEFSYLIILPLLITTTLLAMLIRRKAHGSDGPT